tara:strand:+ start:117 stop:734 length:618 start_codon:yes stop_codon:yes gene_type:complete
MASDEIKRKELSETIYSLPQVRKILEERSNGFQARKAELNSLSQRDQKPDPQLKPSGGPIKTYTQDQQRKEAILKEMHSHQLDCNQQIEKEVHANLEGHDKMSLKEFDTQELLDEQMMISASEKPHDLVTNQEINSYLKEHNYQLDKSAEKETAKEEFQSNKQDVWKGMDRRWEERLERAESPEIKENEKGQNKRDMGISPDDDL